VLTHVRARESNDRKCDQLNPLHSA
jgi:hypothetical protein